MEGLTPTDDDRAGAYNSKDKHDQNTINQKKNSKVCEVYDETTIYQLKKTKKSKK